MHNHFTNSDSLKAYIKDQSKKNNISVNHCYLHFFGRNLLEKISLFRYEKLALKGSFVQYVHLGKMTRPTTDIDFATPEHHRESINTIILKTTSYDFGDNIKWHFNSKPVITKTGVIKLKLYATFDKIIQPISIDLSSNNYHIYEIQRKQMPCTFECDAPFDIYTPSHEEHLAEKVCIIAESNKEDVLNTRIKDFYDIYELHGGNYDREKFAQYFEMAIIDRNKININNLSTEHLNNEFINRHQEMWNSLSKKYEFLDKNIDFCGALYYSRAVLSEQIQRIRERKQEGILYENKQLIKSI
jgi:hypothetical protein